MFLLGNVIENYGYQFGYLLVITCMITLTMVPLTVILVKDIREIQQIMRREEENSSSSTL